MIITNRLLISFLVFMLATPAKPQKSDTWAGNVILGRPTDRSVTASVIFPNDQGAVYLEYGEASGSFSKQTPVRKGVNANKPYEEVLGGLKPDQRYFYRVRNRKSPQDSFAAGPEYTFHTQRLPGSSFAFAVQGDSHPERLNRMYDPTLYLQTMHNVRADQPDFYITLGDDFSLDQLYNRQNLNPETVAQVYLNQRRFLGLVGVSAPLFLVNGNHEHAAAYLLDGAPNNPAVLAGRARNLYYPQPAPDTFYTGDNKQVESIGLLRDYYAWTWGDALFVTLDPYWHSPVQVDSGLGGQAGRKGGVRNRDWWGITIGDAQYQWFKKTLEQSKARYKFVFAHHVLGTGRGAIEMADLYEWGGKNRAGDWEFDKKRPGWELPIHQLMVKNGVTIFFQGHDHLFARQQRDGVLYQETPNPADQDYSVYNREAYRSGDILPNSGHLRVTVSPESVKVDYVRSYLPKDETADRKNGEIAFSYAATPGNPKSK